MLRVFWGSLKHLLKNFFNYQKVCKLIAVVICSILTYFYLYCNTLYITFEFFGNIFYGIYKHSQLSNCTPFDRRRYIWCKWIWTDIAIWGTIIRSILIILCCIFMTFIVPIVVLHFQTVLIYWFCKKVNFIILTYLLYS